MDMIHANDRARLLHTRPHYHSEAAAILERLCRQLSFYPLGKRVLAHATISPGLADRMAAWGADLADYEDGGDVEFEEGAAS